LNIRYRIIFFSSKKKKTKTLLWNSKMLFLFSYLALLSVSLIKYLLSIYSVNNFGSNRHLLLLFLAVERECGAKNSGGVDRKILKFLFCHFGNS
jgi:hypothetical protein